jgi:hypothetical protein
VDGARLARASKRSQIAVMVMTILRNISCNDGKHDSLIDSSTLQEAMIYRILHVVLVDTRFTTWDVSVLI